MCKGKPVEIQVGFENVGQTSCFKGTSHVLSKQHDMCWKLDWLQLDCYKALSRSLNIQVLFIETTLFTPRRCFERATEKCYDDSLSSIVASCSWDKHVTVETGSQFDSLWDQKETGFDQISGMDVYHFLHMVSSAGRNQF